MAEYRWDSQQTRLDLGVDCLPGLGGCPRGGESEQGGEHDSVTEKTHEGFPFRRARRQPLLAADEPPGG